MRLYCILKHKQRIEELSNFVDRNSELCHVLILCHHSTYMDQFDRINFHVTAIRSICYRNQEIITPESIARQCTEIVTF